MPASPHVMFAGGGAPGHLYPGIAVAEHLAGAVPNVRISFAGPGRPREKHTVHTAGFQYTTIPSQPMPQNPLQVLRFVTDNVAGYCAARWMLGEQKVSLVVGMGGYTSTAVVRAALSRGIPFLLLEQNALPSRTTRWFARDAALVCAAFEEVRPHLHVQAPINVTGNPARPAFEQLYRRKFANSPSDDAGSTLVLQPPSSDRPKRLIILGGAGGARSLNDSMPRALKQLGDSLADWQIIHQTGEGQLQKTEGRYRQCGVEALAVTFIDEIASVLFASDLVVCRSGGTTLAELALAGVPAVLVPYPQASEDHQLANAKVVAEANACRLVDESSQTGALDKALARELLPLVMEKETRQQMSQEMRRLARPQASAEIAAAIEGTLFGSRSNLLAA
ncbi:MAG: UDP-N-acetylglucosamine--N-acetylmuramyl-(pentapeptide) pyrophosphoryl-undecaprenol N-acetylglucosamine transferase [Pirellulales bacterium]|nr:UDP-N-acetylglucosamine--N-acetylmuramyl-(pentapeptide) pyrophosphoryl-undecaprenol N-acetylglucosamine transferase [Pirellulales bacterium]